jgi:hypothetical protein
MDSREPLWNNLCMSFEHDLFVWLWLLLLLLLFDTQFVVWS